MFRIKRYEPEFLDKVRTLHKVAMERTGAYKGEGPWDADLNSIESVYFKNRGEFVVGEYHDDIVAMGAFKNSDNVLAEIKRMRVHPNYQGIGFGRIILEFLEYKAREYDYKGLTLETSVHQLSAQRLYVKNGFEEVGREEIDGIDCIRFQKLLK